jgi:outer membrane protein assembly factor BamB
VPLDESGRELVLERLGGHLSVSVFRPGALPEVWVYEECVRPDAALVALRCEASRIGPRGTGPRRAAGRPPARPASPEWDARTRALASEAEQALLDLERQIRDGRLDAATDATEALAPDVGPALARETVVVEAEPGLAIEVVAELALRVRGRRPKEPLVERSDLHALLFPGTVRLGARGRLVSLGNGLPFVCAQQLLELASEVMERAALGRSHAVRRPLADGSLAVRLSANGELALTLLGSDRRRPSTTFPALRSADLGAAAVTFGRALVRAITRHDHNQRYNLRLARFREALRELERALDTASDDEEQLNPCPEPYRAYAVHASQSPSPARELTSVRLRYTPRWRALVPGIDLRSTYLCGDRIVVGASKETFGLDRTSGRVLWRQTTERATCVVTPSGLARLHADGDLHVHDLGTGERRFRLRIHRRTSAPPAGAVVHAPGLPRLLVLTDGEQHLSSVDLGSGEVRWRHALRARGAVRLRRGGKLLYALSGDGALHAIDVVSGSTVWRLRKEPRFGLPFALDKDQLFAVRGGLDSRARLVRIDAFEGRCAFDCPLGDEPCTVDGPPLVGAATVALVMREQGSVRLRGFDRDQGELLWRSPGPLAPVGTSWLAVDDLFIGNTPRGELVGVDARSGAVRYRRTLGRLSDADVPRRLEPILRSGALFVPSADVHVVRPRDGSSIGLIGPSEAVADLLRVDERCDVYVAEESGHLIAFGAGPQLSVVR